MQKNKIKEIFNNKKLLTGLIVLAIVAVGFGLYQLIPKHNVFVKAPGLNYQRKEITAVKLNDGTVLVFGGKQTAEIYYPDKNKYEILPNEMNRARTGATATLMQDGRVFIIGGENTLNRLPPPTAEIYDPKTKNFTLIKGSKEHRIYHAASLLNDGRILVTGGLIGRVTNDKYGGRSFGYTEVTNAEIYNPKLNIFTALKLPHPMFYHQQVTLNDGRVLIISGDDRDGRSDKPHRRDIHAEIFDTVANKFITINPPQYKHRRSTTTLLKDGLVLVAGGDDNIPISNVEIFDPETNKFKQTDDMTKPRTSFSATLLQDGNVLIIGGVSGYAMTLEYLKSAEIYYTKQGIFAELFSNMHKKRREPVAVLLNNGNVLIPDNDFSEIYLK